jgi:hypothetical protein
MIAWLLGLFTGIVITALWHYIDNADEPAEDDRE